MSAEIEYRHLKRDGHCSICYADIPKMEKKVFVTDCQKTNISYLIICPECVAKMHYILKAGE